jgi:hypothetical protein
MFILLAALGGGRVWADETANTLGAPAAPVQEAADAGDEVECRSQPITGSHMKKKVCMTRFQWDIARKQAQDDLRRETTKQGNVRLAPR